MNLKPLKDYFASVLIHAITVLGVYLTHKGFADAKSTDGLISWLTSNAAQIVEFLFGLFAIYGGVAWSKARDLLAEEYEKVLDKVHVAPATAAATPAPVPAPSAQSIAKTITSTASVLVIAALALIGCTAAQEKTVVTDATTVVADIDSFLTAANALWTVVGKTLTSSQFESLLTSFGVPASQFSAIESVIGLGSQYGTDAITVTSEVVSLLDAYNAQISQ